jgi:hypothetical protein
VTSTILGASKLRQLEDNLRAIEFSIPAELRQQLNEISAPASIHPYMFFEPFLQNMIHGAKVHAWTPNRVSPSQPASQREEAVGAEKIA